MDATVKVRLRNRVLQVPAEDKEKYLQQGYTVYDMDGNLIAEPPTDANRLKGANAEIASLTEKLKEAGKRRRLRKQRHPKSPGKTLAMPESNRGGIVGV